MNTENYTHLYGDSMENYNLLHLLTFSLFSELLIFIFGTFMWGIFLINISAFYYYLLSKNKIKHIIILSLFFVAIYLILNLKFFLLISTFFLFTFSIYLIILEAKYEVI